MRPTRWIYTVPLRLRSFFRRRDVDHELDEELRFHIEQKAAQYAARGLNPAEARRRAMLDMNGFERSKEECRDMRKVNWLHDLIQDLRYGARMLRKTPAFTLAALLTLGLCIGANTAIFSLVNAILLRQLPFDAPEQLVWVTSKRPDRDDAPFTLPEYMDYRDQNQSFEHLAAYVNMGLNLTGAGEPERLQGLRASANFFAALRAKARIGRTLQPEDDHPANPRVVVLGYSLWERRFGADPNVLGRALVLSGTSYEVVGVLAPEFIFPERAAELAIPLVPDAHPWRHARSSTHFLRLLGRLKPGVSRGQAEQEMGAICDRLRQLFPVEAARDIGVRVSDLHETLVGNFRRSLWVLLGAMGLVLLAASANLANLLLTRASARQREIALRRALGATRTRVVRQLVTEGLLLALAGGALGLLLAFEALQLLLRLAPADLPRISAVEIDSAVLGWTLGISTLAGLLFSLAPALRASRTEATDALKETGRGFSEGRRVLGLRNILVMAEVSLAAVLLLTGGLLLKSFDRLQRVDPGFQPRGLLVARISLPEAHYPNREAVQRFYDKLRFRMAAVPGVDAVGVVSLAPMAGLFTSVPFTVEGRPPDSANRAPSAQYRIIGSGYMRAMGIPVLQGQEFTDADSAETRPVALVSRTLARQFFPEGDAIGKHLRIDDNNTGPRPVEIVGVVGDVKQSSLDRSPTYDVYISLEQMHPDAVVWMRSNMFWMLRTKHEPMALASSFRTALREVAYDVPASSVQPMESYFSASVAPRRFNLQLLAVFSIAGLLLATTGIYGVMSYSVSLRARELGILMALGARRETILMQVLRNGAVVALIGMAAGLAGAAALGRVIQGLLFEVDALDAVTYAAVMGVLLATSLLACYLPARRAAGTDPLRALRCE